MPSARSRLFYRLLKYQASRAGQNASLEQQREQLESLAKYQPMPPKVDVQRTQAGNVPAEWLRPGGTGGDRALLFFHGGGYTMGSCNTNRALAARVAVASAAPALIFDYRLAPENPFPAALEDALAAYRWLISSGISPRKIAFAGGSAGGGLAMAAAVSLRDDGDPLPAAIVCLSPWVDLALTGESMTTRAGFCWFAEFMVLAQTCQGLRILRICSRRLASPSRTSTNSFRPKIGIGFAFWAS